MPKSCGDGTDFRSSKVGVIRVSLIWSGRRSLPKARGRLFAFFQNLIRWQRASLVMQSTVP